MAKFQSPLLGYNNNVRHKGRVFHIQTEDSGVNHPHIITHLFMDGGRILKSVKTSYAEHVGSDGMSETVRGMMKDQHKAMFIALRDGHYDGLLDPTAPKKTSSAQQPAAKVEAPTAKVEVPAAKVEAPTAKVEVPTPLVEIPTPLVEVPAFRDEAPTAVVQPPRMDEDPHATPELAPIPPAPPLPAIFVPTVLPAVAPAAQADVHRHAASSHGRSPTPLPPEGSLPPELEALMREDVPEAPPTTRDFTNHGRAEVKENERRHQSVKELTLDFDALGSDQGTSPLFQKSDLPPPPKNLFTKPPRTAPYRAMDADAPAPERPSYRPPPNPSRPPPKPASGHGPVARPAASAPPPKSPSSDNRYAPARPAAIFGAAAKQASVSIFSDELVSDKSLDEVILSYLAEDLDPPRRK